MTSPQEQAALADSRALRLAALVSLVAGALALGSSGLIAAPICLLSVVMILAIGLAAPRWFPQLVRESPQRTAAALVILGVLIAATAASGPGALFSGQLSGAFSTVVAELALPAGIPIGLLAALAAGALVAVCLELGERRGVQSALVLGIAVLGLASVAAPGRHLVPAIVLGWPATIFALTRLAGMVIVGPAAKLPLSNASSNGRMSGASRRTRVGDPSARPPAMRRTPPTGSDVTSADGTSTSTGSGIGTGYRSGTGPRSGYVSASVRAVSRWQVLPVLAAIATTLAVLTVAVLAGVATLGERATGWGRGDGSGVSGGGRSASDYLGGEMNLSARGDLGPEPVLSVTDSSPTLWRAGTLDQYTGQGWLTTVPPAGLPKLVTDPSGVATVSPAPASSPGVLRTDQVRTIARQATQILAPGELINLSSSSLSTGGSAFVFAGDRVTLVSGSQATGRYEVRSRVVPRVDDVATFALLTAGAQPAGGTEPSNGTVPGGGTAASDGPAAGGGTATGDGTVPSGDAGTDGGTKVGGGADVGPQPGPVVDEALDPRWTALPQDVPLRVRRLGSDLVANAPSRLAAVQAVEAELARRMTYTLNSPVPPRGADTVDDVLFVSHSGFCEQFATAEVVLLRSAGVPARVAVGFSGGEPGQDGFRTLRRSDAHAWVEVWFPGVGWVTSDPTPAAARSQTWWQPISDVLRPLLAGPTAWVMALLVPGLITAVMIMIRRRRSARATSEGGPVRKLDPDLAAAFTRLEAGLRAEGRPRGPSETVAALSRRLGPPQQAGEMSEQQPDPALLQAMHVLERALYAAEQPSREECLAAAAAINQSLHPSPARAR